MDSSFAVEIAFQIYLSQIRNTEAPIAIANDAALHIPLVGIFVIKVIRVSKIH